MTTFVKPATFITTPTEIMIEADLEQVGLDLNVGRLSDQCIEDFAACLLDVIRQRIGNLEIKRTHICGHLSRLALERGHG